MKNAMAVLMAAVFVLGTATASPVGQGGGSTPTDNESNLTGILMITFAAGFAALIIGDIISDSGQESQDALAGYTAPDTASEDTGVNWEQFSAASPEESVPVLAVAVFPGDSGRDLARYLTGLLAPGENLLYTTNHAPVALGAMSSSQAATTGFSFMNCDMFVTGDETGFQLFERGIADPVWTYGTELLDSASVRQGASGLVEFFSAR